MIKYKSTRGSGNEISSAEAILKGIADDKGLFVPTSLPSLGVDLYDLKNMDYKAIAYEVLSKFMPDYSEEELKYCIDSAYNKKFEEEEIVPVKKAGDVYFAELYHGRTAAFKDMALSILPYLLTTAMEKLQEERRIVILTATSGDTGKAALAGFAGVPKTEIIVFYPNEGVSEVQRRQMVTQSEDNTHVYAIRGNFDDAQAGVKKLFNDAEFAKELEAKGCKLSSANSINIGRLIPQVAYYVWSYAQLLKQNVLKPGEPMNVVVPTGNFGNILAAYYAKQMGIPVHKFICASNENKVLTDFIHTGIYDAADREFHITNSPSMDILISSNIERLLYHLSGEDCEEVARMMDDLEHRKLYHTTPRIKGGLSDLFAGGFATEEETLSAIGDLYEGTGYLVDTHTAVAYKVYEDYRKETSDLTPAVIASTASAYKFADSALKALGLPACENGFKSIDALHEKTGVRVPSELRGLGEREVVHKAVVEKDALMLAVKEALKVK